MERPNVTHSTLIWSLFGVMVSLVCLIGSVVILPGLEWAQLKSGTVGYGGHDPQPYIHLPEKVWHLELYGHTLYTNLDEETPFQPQLLKVILPVVSAISLLVFLVIYRTSYRAQFRE